MNERQAAVILAEEQAVRAGAKLLDERRPGWAKLIDLGSLKLSNCERCVLGQVFGGVTMKNSTEPVTGFDVGVAALELEDGRDIGRLGFELVPEVDSRYFGAINDVFYIDGVSAWDRLGALWAKEIEDRTL